MRLGLGGSTGQIYDLLARAGEHGVEVAKLVQQRFEQWPAGPSQDDVKSAEHRGDETISALLTLANTSFVTPFDRDDLVALAFAVDEVADAGENASELLGLYGIESPTRQSLELCALYLRAAEQLAALLARLKGVRGSADEILAIKELEDQADHVARAARAGLFKDERIDPTIVIRWKDIYEALEEAVDACETAAHRVGNILVKNQ